MTERLGQFRAFQRDDGPLLLTFGPRTVAEHEQGVPLIAYTLWADQSKMSLNPDHLADFLNAALAASFGNSEPLKRLASLPVPPRPTVSQQ